MKPNENAFTWPGRDRLSWRARILLEARTVKELIAATGTVTCAGELDSVLGFFEYLHSDWLWLHDEQYRAKNPKDYSEHAWRLRKSADYVAATKWDGAIPRTSAVSDLVALHMN